MKPNQTRISFNEFDDAPKTEYMYLFFDTETTGLPRNWRAPITDLNNWPRMVQIAWILSDKTGSRIEAGDFIIKPENFVIPLNTTRIHGISTEKALHEGKNLLEILTKFNDLVNEAEYLVAHNISFDEKIIGAEFLRMGMESNFLKKRKLCTMKSSTNYCRIPGPYGFKYPKLSELHFRLFGEDFDEAHNAAVDIHATEKCFWEMRKRGWI
ncbi:MAG: 3'-5' exonuclease [Mariniphaga sp.]|nr:3'-5' exonuclease [Mariniphaga sp.]MDD4225698.1 3'-5' exonuclease [Mariniphaga sp.]